ncbi:class I SAM-dependent methyltransferase [Consotaella salsifontis]|uniref:16S rRNA (Guanine1207-N2)-methyltransferase n=1 Tax=Consotaella salsifontis TaxID=1365950 RepID=A0A1T4L0Z4_9HYPH|nr:class I SAM-dependent methyltransferase [Consotaella salsifontis]SJZ48268.1 16S rRNA (guanine1207-N2)-methyltransferase [Consotaella salsifontis]
MSEVDQQMSDVALMAGVYGDLPPELASTTMGAHQFSPLVPGAAALEQEAPQSLDELTMLAPRGTVERRYEMALALKALKEGAAFTVAAPKDRGGTRLRKELEGFGCSVAEESRRHHRIASCRRPDLLHGVDEAIAEGSPRVVEPLGLVSQPGIFAWDRIDPASALLMEHLPPLKGSGADFGCGVGILSRAVLASPAVTGHDLIDIDRRAVACARRNIEDDRARFFWADILKPDADMTDLDFVVMNPPFHDAGTEDRNLGQNFIRKASRSLRKGGVLWLTANRHLPYEAVLKEAFRNVRSVAEENGYKIFEAVK